MSLRTTAWKIIFEVLKPKADLDKLVQLSSEDLDEDELLTLCLDHGILLIVNESLKAVAQQIFSTSGLEQWRTAVASSTLHSLEMHRELQRLTSLFSGTEILVLPFKGPVLSKQLYGDPLLRMSADLDFLVPREHVVKAVDLLIKDGYRPTFDRYNLDRWLKPNFRHFHCGLLHPTSKWLVEIHWLLFAGWRKAHFQHTTGSERFPGGVGDVIETLLYLCNHGAHHWWTQLKWVVDVDKYVRCASDLDWHLLFSRARERGCLRVVCMALVLTQQVCGLALPDAVVDVIRKDPKATSLAQRASQKWSLSVSRWPSLLWKMHYLLDCRERMSDKTGMIFGYPLLRSLPVFPQKKTQ